MHKPNILIIYPYNKRSNSIETVLFQINKFIGKVHVVTQVKTGPLYKYLNEENISYKCAGIGEIRYRNLIKIIFYAIFIRKEIEKSKSTIVIAHQQFSFLLAFIALIGKNVKIHYFRHNSDADELNYGKKGVFLNSICNFLLDSAIAPTNQVSLHWKSEPNMKRKEVRVIPYLYNFEIYGKLNKEENSDFKRTSQRFSESHIIILGFNRLNKMKKVDELINLIYQLRLSNIDAYLINFGEGEELENLLLQIEQLGLKPFIELREFIDNPYPYFNLADFFVCMSESEASNSAVKEAAFFGVPLIVKADVGDFSDYLINTEYSCILNKNDPVMQASEFIQKYIKNSKIRRTRHLKLSNDITSRYSSASILKHYDFLNNNII